jgi:hypothetical protein
MTATTNKGMRRYVALLGAILRGDKTANQICEATGINVRSARPNLRCMVRLGLIHVCGVDGSASGTPQAIFCFGPGVNAEMPLSKRFNRPCESHWSKEWHRTPTSEMIALKSVIKAMEEGGATKTEIIEQTGVHWSTLALLIRDMKRDNLAHICGWVSSMEGYPAAIFAYGPGRDVRKPKPECKRERSLRYYHQKRGAEKAMAAHAVLAGVASLEAV